MAEDGNNKSDEIDLGLLPGLVGYQLRRAQIETFQHFVSNLGDEGMRPGWFGLLIIVANNPGLSQTQLARALGVDGSTMVAMIDRMEQSGWVARLRSKTDRRSHELHLTDAGVGMLARVTPMVRDHDAAITANLTEPESGELLRLLRKVTGV
ncbi:MAG: MarR family transcriptional regulator [Proteobacteria bacterium]|nr:MarR family transcriptional regulator [Pseudomonadota bacterium]